MSSPSIVRRKRAIGAGPAPSSNRQSRSPPLDGVAIAATPLVVISLVALYVVLTLWETQPLPSQLDVAIVGFLDAPVLSLWNTWWTRFALLDLHQNPYFTNYVLYPFGVNLALHTYSFVTALLTIPTAELFGPVLGFNLILLASFVATALGGAFFARGELGVGWWPASFAGAAMTFSANVGAHLTHGHYNLTTLWAIPWCFLAVGRALRTRSWRWAALAGLFAGIQGLQDLYLSSALAIALLLFVASSSFWRGEKDWTRRVVQLVAFVGVAVVIFLPEAIALWAERSEIGGLNQDLESASVFSPDLVAYFVPGYLNPFFATFSVPIADRLHYLDVPKEVYVGWTLLLLAALSVRAGIDVRRRLRPFWIIAGVFFLLSLGPYLHAFGQIRFGGIGPIPLPYSWFHALPLISLARTPGNNVVMVTFALAVVGSVTLQRLIQRWPSVGRVVVGIAIAVAAIEAKTELPLTPASDRPMFDWLSAQGSSTLVEIPSGLRDGRQGFGDSQGFVQTDQIYHHQRILGGFIARIPDQVFAGYESDHVLAYFADPQHAPPPSGEVTLARLQTLNARYVLVYGSPSAAAIRVYLTGAVHLVLVRQETGLWLYSVPGVTG